VSARQGKLGVLAAAFAVGTIVAIHLEPRVLWPWGLAIGTGSILCAITLRRRGPWLLWPLVVTAAALGAVRYETRQHTAGRDHLAALVCEPMLVRLHGRVLETPVVRRPGGSMAAFHYRRPAAYFPLRVESIAQSGGRVLPCRGEVMVRVEEPVAVVAGTGVEVTGLLLPPRPPRNPGELDGVRYARATGQAGLLNVPRGDLVRVTSVPRGGAVAAFRPWLRARAGDWLAAGLGPRADPQRRALLESLLLGERGPDLAGLQDSVRRVGLAHFLAISGLHLGVLAGLVLLGARALGLGDRGQGVVTIGVVILYLALVEVRMPVLRAGCMAIAASLGLACGRRYNVGSLLAASAVGLLWWQPSEILSPGFQLSFGVVLGLVYLGPVLRRRWFGAPNLLAASRGQMVREWLKSTWATAGVAWAVATPSAAWHWGLLWPLAPPLSVAALPVVAAVLALGYATIILAAVVPAASLVVGVATGFCADVLIALIDAARALPGVTLPVPVPSVAWSITCAAWVSAWVVFGLRSGTSLASGRGRALLRAAGLILALWLWWPALRGAGAGLSIDMLAVGDGSCYLVRSGRSAVVFDAGSSSRTDAGRRLVVPALRRLGVCRLDAVVVSHANLDHYSAVLEIADAFVPRVVIVTPHLVAAGREDPQGPVAYLLTALEQRGVTVERLEAGEVRDFGSTRWTWLHPRADDDFEAVNDRSMVVCVESAGGSLLLTGDIQAGAMAALQQRARAVAVDVLELPHHGTHHSRAVAFVETVGPRVVLQSTGRGNWHRTRESWTPAPAGRMHLVSARDGACRVVLDPDGGIEVTRFNE
jgi:competence protein ComEC